MGFARPPAVRAAVRSRPRWSRRSTWPSCAAPAAFSPARTPPASTGGAATARTGVPHVRQHVPERLLTTWLAVDVSPSMAFGTTDRLKSDVAEGVVDVVGTLAVRRGGKVGLLTFGAPVSRLLPPRGGRGARIGLRRALGEGVAPDGTAGSARTSSEPPPRSARPWRWPSAGRPPSTSSCRPRARGPASWAGGWRERHRPRAVDAFDLRQAPASDAFDLTCVYRTKGRTHGSLGGRRRGGLGDSGFGAARMSFAAPAFLAALALVPLTILAQVAGRRRARRYAIRFTGVRTLAPLVPQVSPWRRQIPLALFLAALTALALALARPHATVAVPREQATIVLVNDVSRSMLATDVDPSRMEAARSAAQRFLEQLPDGALVGAGAFPEEPHTVEPPTEDKAEGQAMNDR